jgi:subtilisin family serine protease
MLIGVAACVEQPVTEPNSAAVPSFSRAPGNPAPIHRAPARNKGKPDEFVVVLNEGVTSDDVAKTHGVVPHHKFEKIVNGFAAKLSNGDLRKLENDARVKYLQEDVVPVLDVMPFTSAVASALSTQSSATWGIDRIDQRDSPLSGTYEYTNDGTGVNVYMVDSGIRTTHTEFASGRAKAGLNGYDAFGGDGQDCYGHGTHTAGTVGGAQYGVAKKATLYSVRIFNCEGGGAGVAEILGGLEWIINHKIATNKPAVSNSSWAYTGLVVPVIDDAFLNMTAHGIVNVVAAGNQYGADACLSTPAHVPTNITVGASDAYDIWAGFSNSGACVDIIAPGVNVSSAWWTSNSAVSTLTGTSMSAPHVAGVLAEYLQRNKQASPAVATDALLDVATFNRILYPPAGTPNLLLHRLNGTVAANGQVYMPHGLYYCTTARGMHTGHLTGTAGTNFDLELQRWTGTAWVTVQAKVTAATSETISYNNTDFTGYHYWRYIVRSAAGSGTFDLYIRRPAGPRLTDAATGVICP